MKHNIKEHLHIILIVVGVIFIVGGVGGAIAGNGYIGNALIGVVLVIAGLLYYRNYIDLYNPNAPDPIVYHVGSSEVYHRDWACQSLNTTAKDLEEIRESKAVKMGLRPCKMCDYLKKN